MTPTETGYAKLNLALHVRRRREDGYHELETLFAFCADGDAIELLDGDGAPLAVGGEFAGALAGDNLILRAADRFRAAFGGGPARFRLDKRLPVAAGIGGGSADAGAALRLLARREGVGIEDPGLLAIAAELGADVPACVASITVRGDGRGDALRPVAGSVTGTPVLLVNPRLPLATGPVFAGWDAIDRGALGDGDPLAVAAAGRNDLEAPALALVHEIGRVLAALSAQPGATLVRMSGSGATCFALFADDAARDRASAAIGVAQAGWWRLATTLR